PGTPQTVNYGGSITFTIVANTGYHIADVGVDGVSQGAIGSYTFGNVTANHTITAAFALNPPAGLSADNDSPTTLGSATILTAVITDGLQVTYAWSFGDGTPPAVGAGATVTHTYAAAGTYTASVTATNDSGSLTALTLVYVITNPIAQAGIDQTVSASRLVTLNGSASLDPGNFLPLTYHWQQTGGPAVTLTGANNVTATFTSPAITQTQVLTFELTVTNSQGLTSLPDVVVITVEPYRLMLPLALR
ncbi:MAG TPA: PKD domain-containing protein, partial [Anaerolineae bacterium]|nr:PKD domain-containing protein [Anaerolineae bacterium]